MGVLLAAPTLEWFGKPEWLLQIDQKFPGNLSAVWDHLHAYGGSSMDRVT